MFEDMAPKMAKVITEYSQPVQAGDVVVIQASTVAEPIIFALYEAILRRGGHPITYIGFSDLGETLLELGNDEQLAYSNPAFAALAQEANIFYNILANDNTHALGKISPQRITLRQQAQAPVQQQLFQRFADESVRVCILPWPTQADAQEAGMGLNAYRRFVYEACALHTDDPVAHWESMRQHQEQVATYLYDKHHAHVKGPGIDLKFEFGGRLWVNSAGNINFPDGEIYTGPIEDSVSGSVDFNLRTVFNGREVEGVHFVFRDGVIIDASATKGEDYLFSQLNTDAGARRLGEFAIGTNWNIKEVTGSALFDEKIGGTIHMAIGRSIPHTLGQNVSAIHWDMVHDMKKGGEISIDGELFYQNGHFVSG